MGVRQAAAHVAASVQRVACSAPMLVVASTEATRTMSATTPVSIPGEDSNRDGKTFYSSLSLSLNKRHGQIQFTMEMENSGFLPFMDIIRITRQPPGELTKEVYQKPTHTNRYVPVTHHPISVKSGVVACLANRAIRVSGSQAGRDAELGRIQKVMMRNGYPSTFINKVVSSQINDT